MAVDKIRAELGGLARTLQDGELSLRASARENLQLGLVVQHTVTFHEATADLKGPLSAGVEDLGSMDMLQAELGRRLQESSRKPATSSRFAPIDRTAKSFRPDRNSCSSESCWP